MKADLHIHTDISDGSFDIKETLKIAAEGTTQGWKMKQERLSPRYTTRWEDLPEAR